MGKNQYFWLFMCYECICVMNFLLCVKNYFLCVTNTNYFLCVTHFYIYRTNKAIEECESKIKRLQEVVNLKKEE